MKCAGVCSASSSDPAGRRVDAQLQRLEVQPGARAVRDHDLPVDHAALRQLGPDPGHQLGEVAGHRPLVAAADLHLVAVPEHDRPEAVPLRLEHVVAVRDRLDRLGQHRRHGRVDRKVHRPQLPTIISVDRFFPTTHDDHARPLSSPHRPASSRVSWTCRSGGRRDRRPARAGQRVEQGPLDPGHQRPGVRLGLGRPRGGQQRRRPGPGSRGPSRRRRPAARACGWPRRPARTGPAPAAASAPRSASGPRPASARRPGRTPSPARPARARSGWPVAGPPSRASPSAPSAASSSAIRASVSRSSAPRVRA